MDSLENVPDLPSHEMKMSQRNGSGMETQSPPPFSVIGFLKARLSTLHKFQQTTRKMLASLRQHMAAKMTRSQMIPGWIW